MRMIYLDYNATTPIAPAAQEAVIPFIADRYGDPASRHSLGRICQEAVEDARTQLASMLHAESHEIIFTSGGTESNNQAVKGVAFRGAPATGHLIVSTLDHPSVLQAAKWLESIGYDLTILGCDSTGMIDPASVESAIRPDTLLVSISHANGDIGSIQPIREIADVCRARGVPLHCDACQSFGKIPVGVDELGVDSLSISGHKMYGPKGVGVLYVRKGTPIEPLLHGSLEEGGLRGGTENVPHIVAMGAAAEVVEKAAPGIADHLASLRDRMQGKLLVGVGEKLTINAMRSQRLPNTLSVNFPNANAAAMLKRIPELCVSTDASWGSGSENLSPALMAIGLLPEQTRGTIRISVGWYTSEAEIDRASNMLLDAWEAETR